MRQISDTMRTAYACDFTVSYYYGCGYLVYTNSHERITPFQISRIGIEDRPTRACPFLLGGRVMVNGDRAQRLIERPFLLRRSHYAA